MEFLWENPEVYTAVIYGVICGQGTFNNKDI